MKIHFGGRLFLVAALVGSVALLAVGFVIAMEVRSVVAGPQASPGPPNPGHPWEQLEGHGILGDVYWLGTTADKALAIATNGTTRMLIDAEGNIGIGTMWKRPTELVHIMAGGASKKDVQIEHILTDGTGLTGVYRPFDLGVVYSATDLLGVNSWQGIRSGISYGYPGVPATGTVHSSTFDLAVAGAGSDWNEYTPIFAALRYDIGDGFWQTTGPTGRGWLTDFNVHGPVGVQPDLLNGITLFYNNYYNGSPSHSPGGGIWIVTKKGAGGATTDIHSAANTYPVDVGLGIVGASYAGAPGKGFEKAIQIGGYGSGWMESGTSMIGTGIDMRDFANYGLYIHDRNASGTGPAIAVADNAGDVGVGTTSPGQKLEVNGGMRLNTTTARPACTSATRGTLWFTQGGSGAKDTLAICAKDASNAYNWRVIY